MSIQTNKLPDNPQIKVLKSGKTGLFTNYIYKAIPLAFDESMSYYETLCGLLHYLKNVVIPTVNNNADAVAELQSLYEELRTYVNDYFKDLDVQEEINNKLDEMVEDGTLDQIIEQYLNSSAIWGFDTVNDMKNATNLINGSYARTLGYHSKNDGGGALYKVRTITNDDVVDNMFIISLNDNSLIGELIIENDVNVKQLGAYGDGTHDDTERLQYIINMNIPLIFDDSIYMINNNGLLLINNTSITFNNTTLKMITNNYDGYKILNINNCDNINLKGNLYLIGDKETHTGNTGEYGHCIQIIGSSNIVIENVNCSYAWGDGIYLGKKDEGKIIPQNIIINNLICHHNSRNGLSITAGKNVVVNNLISHHNTRTSPRGGFDIEPNDSYDIIDVTLNNVYVYDNGITPSVYQAFISNGHSDNYIVNIGTINIKGQLSITINNDKSIINIDNINIETLNNQTTGCVLTCHGKINIKNLYIKLVETIKTIIYTEYLYGFINNLLIKNNANNANFINNCNNVLLTIDNLDFNGNYVTESSTNKTNIRINNIVKRIQEINNTDNRHIKAFSTVINISNDVASISYNDIMTYDNYIFYIANNNESTNCNVSLNLKKFLYNGNLTTVVSLPYGNIMKVRFDIISGFYVVEYLRPLT